MFLAPFYDAVVRTKDDPPAQVFVLGFDSEPIRAEKSFTTSRPGPAAIKSWQSRYSLPAQEFLERAATSNDPVQHEWHTRFQAPQRMGTWSTTSTS